MVRKRSAVQIRWTAPEKKTFFDKEKCLFFIDINLCRDFRYVINDAICADTRDMLPCGNEIYIISSLSKVKTYRFYESKNIEQTQLHIDENYKYLYGSAFPKNHMSKRNILRKISRFYTI